jgi:hypothetical protein
MTDNEFWQLMDLFERKEMNRLNINGFDQWVIHHAGRPHMGNPPNTHRHAEPLA